MKRVPRNISIILEKDDSGQPIFHMEEEGKGLMRNAKGIECITFNKHDEKMDKHDHHEVHFKLVDKGNVGLVFCNDRDNVMWAKVVPEIDDDCPDSEQWLEGKFYAEKVHGEQKHLTVVNTNMKQEYVAFRLNFVPKGEFDVPPDEYVAYDPIGQNQNGGFPMIGPDD
jgi:hypothetical protein